MKQYRTTTNFLDEILQHKRKEVSHRKREVPFTELLHQARTRDDARRGFAVALKRAAEVALVAEIKRRSPSAGRLRDGVVPAERAQTYERAGAAAISVLTDERFFGGTLADLQEVRTATTLPLLRKDFVLDPYQVAEAKAFGADAVLLILAALEPAPCREVAAAAREFELDVLAEVHTAEELALALELGFDLIGVNNRDLHTFEVDLGTTAALLRHVPRGVTLVSESGMRARTDVQRLGRLGVDAVLVGEALMRQEDPEQGVRQFVGVAKCSR